MDNQQDTDAPVTEPVGPTAKSSADQQVTTEKADETGTDTDSPTTAPAPTPAPEAPADAQTGAQTAKLQGSIADLEDAIAKARQAQVQLTINNETKTVDPDDLADAVQAVIDAYTQQLAALQEAISKQNQNNQDFDQQQADFENQIVTITPGANSVWTADQLVNFFAGKTDLNSPVTEADKKAASDAVKKYASVSKGNGSTIIQPSTKKLNDPNNLPSWTYQNAFMDPVSGRMINVVESITDFTPASAGEPSIGVNTGSIGFTPYNVQKITSRLQYFYADTGEVATINALLGIGDLDGHQGVTIDSFANEIHGPAIAKDSNGVFRDKVDDTFGASDEHGQIWFLQPNVSETTYTFYNPTNKEMHEIPGWNKDGVNDELNNSVPEQYVGGIDFAAKLPTPTHKFENLTLKTTQIAVTTHYTIHYQGAGADTPADETKTITWKGEYDPNSKTITWTPDMTDLQRISPFITGYAVDKETAGWTLGGITTDPADQTVTVTYSKVGLPDENAKSNLTVHYVDQNGATIKTDTNQSGAQGEAFNVDAPTISGYRLIAPSQQTTTGKYAGNHMELTLHYLKDGTVPDEVTDANLTVHYVDQNGATIKTDTNQSGAQGEGFTVDAPAIAGYHLVDPSQQTTTGKYVGNHMELTLQYLKDGTVPDEVADANLTVHYVDQNGATIKTDTNESGAQGEAFTVNAPAIAGYHLIDSSQQTITGKYAGNHMELTLRYLKDGVPVDENGAVLLIVHYVDGNGQPIKTDTTQTGAQGAAFTVNAPAISGYTLASSSQQTTTGTFRGNVMELTLVYNQNPTVPDVPVGPNTPVPNGEEPHEPGNDVPETPDVPELPDTFGGGDHTNTGTDGMQTPLADTFAAVTGTKSTRKAVMAVKPGQGVRHTVRNLPQTGEQRQSLLSMLGLVLVAALSGLMFRKRQRG